MNQAEGIRYKKRIRVASVFALITSSVVGIYWKLQSMAAVASSSAMGGIEPSSSTANQVLTASVVVVPVTMLACFALYTILKFIYLRNPGYMLEEGLYSDISWLNTNDKQLVLLDADCIIVASFDESNADLISNEYQHNSGLDNLDYLQSAHTVERIRYSAIDLLKSKNGDNLIEIVSNNQTIKLLFQNSGTKTHALSYISTRLPESLTAEVRRPSDFKTALPQLLAFGFFAVCAAFTYQSAISLLLGVPAVFMLPGILENVFDPTLHSQWSTGEYDASLTNESAAVEHSNDPSNHQNDSTPASGDQSDDVNSDKGNSAARKAA